MSAEAYDYQRSPLADDARPWHWTQDALCQGMDLELFFEFENPAVRKYLTALCEPCPVRATCLEQAMSHNEYGWWAGTSRQQRRIRQRERRGTQKP